MHPFALLLNVAGAVMLLLWSVRMVRTGVERAHGPALRRALKRGRGGPVGMAAAGCVLAILLQSGAAVAVLTSGFVVSGILSVPAGIAAMIGADLGSGLVVKILSFDLAPLIPLLLLVGATLFLKFEARTVRQTGRIVLGIAFILLALTLLGTATEPLRDSAVLPQVVGYLRDDPVTAFVAAAGLAWLLHSSVATLLLLVALAGRSMLPLEVAVPMVLGANLGAGIVAVWLTRPMPREARLIPVANLLFRAVLTLPALAIFTKWPIPLDALGADEGARLVNLHVAFNVLLAVIALPLIRPAERLARLLLPPAATPETTAGPVSALDRGAMATPALALASAKRETLRMGAVVETMLRPVMDLLDSGDAEAIGRVRALDAEVDRTHTDIKLYIAELRRRGLSEEEAQRGIELTSFAISLEHAGDIIDKTLLALAEKKAARRLQFSAEGWAEIAALHARVLANLQMAMNVLVSADVASARALVTEKEVLRKLERDSHNRHLSRLQSGAVESIETSGLHLEAVRALKEINSLLVSVAYPILAETGQLLRSRLAGA